MVWLECVHVECVHVECAHVECAHVDKAAGFCWHVLELLMRMKTYCGDTCVLCSGICLRDLCTYLLRGRDILRLKAASKHSNYVSFYMRISLTCSHAFAQLITPRGEPLPRPIPPPASIVVNLI